MKNDMAAYYAENPDEMPADDDLSELNALTKNVAVVRVNGEEKRFYLTFPGYSPGDEFVLYASELQYMEHEILSLQFDESMSAGSAAEKQAGVLGKAKPAVWIQYQEVSVKSKRSAAAFVKESSYSVNISESDDKHIAGSFSAYVTSSDGFSPVTLEGSFNLYYGEYVEEFHAYYDTPLDGSAQSVAPAIPSERSRRDCTYCVDGNCPSCAGQGYRIRADGKLSPCAACGRSGKCSVCNGRGWVI